MTEERKSVFKEKRFEIIVFLVWFAVVIVIACFHEPWRDEAQAWLIARDDPYPKMLFETTHNEGHPPLWCLLLSPFAKLGAPYELTVKVITLALSGAAMLLFLLYSPFAKPLKIIFSFNFVILYQTPIIARPYVIAFLALILMAMFYGERDEKPVRFVLAEALLCLSHLYGIMLAGVVSMVWVVKIIARYRKEGKLKELFKCRCVLPLFGLLVFALLLVYDISPKENFYSDLAWFSLKDVLPGFVWYTTTFMYYEGLDNDIIRGSVITVIFFVLILFLEKRSKKWCEFTLPYIAVGFFCIFGYGVPHSIIILFYFLLYFLWISYDGELVNSVVEKVRSQSKLIRVGICTAAALLVGMYAKSSVTACYHEIIYTYDSARSIADFIKKYGFEDKVIFAQWIKDSVDGEVFEGNIESGSTDRFDQIETILNDGTIVEDYLFGYNVNPYFTHRKNIFSNINLDSPERGYAYYHIKSNEELREYLYKEKQNGPPDIIVGRLPELELLFGDEDIEYRLVYREYYYNIWQSACASQGYTCIYVRKDLIDETPGLEIVPDDHNSII